jgi:hypothetical protein
MTIKRITSLLLLTTLLSPCAQIGATVSKPTKTSRDILNSNALLQIPFVPNQGQVEDPAVAYAADTFACRVTVDRNGRITYRRARKKKGAGAMEFSERLVGPAVAVQVSGRDQQSARVNDYQGRDPSKWHADLPTYARVNLGHAAPGIRMELKAGGDNVEKLFYVSPGADPAHIRLAVEGAQTLKTTTDGALELNGPSGKMSFTKPVAYQQIDGRRRMVEIRYRVTPKNTYGFEIGPYDQSRELVIDPLVKVFALQRDGNNSSAAMAFTCVAADDQGNIYAAGFTYGQLSIYKFDSRLENILVQTRFSEFASYERDIIRAIELDGQSNVFVAGHTRNTKFPVTPNAFNNNNPGYLWDIAGVGFVAKFLSDLKLSACTFIGGESNFYDLTINNRDQIYVTGYSDSTLNNCGEVYPVTDGAFDTFCGESGTEKAVVTRLSNDLTVVEASTYLGADGDGSHYFDRARDLAIDAQGNIWVTGVTTKPDFPVTDGCLDPTHNGEIDLFISKFDPDLKQLLVSTYLGGTLKEAPTDMLFDGQGNLFLTGYTYSTDFPIPDGGYQSTHSTFEEDGFIVKLSPYADQMLAGTFIGGTSTQTPDREDDVPEAMALSADEKELIVVGRTESASFPITPGYIDNVNEEPSIGHWSHPRKYEDGGDFGRLDTGDGFFSKFSADLSQLTYSTFIGGIRVEFFDDVLINGDDIIIVGESQSGQSTFPQVIDNSSNTVKARVWTKAVALRLNANEAPTDPNNTPADNTNAGSSGGGGSSGGCFLNCAGQ